MKNVGILALQGGVSEHASMVESMGARPVWIRQIKDIAPVESDGIIHFENTFLDAIILPGGESTTMWKLLNLFNLVTPLRTLISSGIPTLGTCAGVITLAQDILNKQNGQESLGVLDIIVDRNAFGSQIASEEVNLDTTWGSIRASFIRAPRIAQLTENSRAEVAATYKGEIVCVHQNNIIGASFHPELTGDTLLHEQLLKKI
ncbi:MAG: pyridoxal 5'-phosphate synthase glutaminase subunit PdxT [Actinomycetaceae bacterium]|nr:pyridoxal 5'-phosphate synthase glutaminase subunit PdxT [Actinomycetaceae bacterium]